jgi:hypothetical protein
VINYDQGITGAGKKDQLLQMYLVERKKVSKWYMKLFRRILSATVLISLVIYRKNIEWKVSHGKFRLHMDKSLLAKYSVPCEILGHRDGDNTIRRAVQQHFTGKTPPTENKC